MTITTPPNQRQLADDASPQCCRRSAFAREQTRREPELVVGRKSRAQAQPQLS